MITLLIGLFGGDKIPPSVRKTLTLVGVGILAYRLHEVYLDYQINKEADRIATAEPTAPSTEDVVRQSIASAVQS